MSTFKTRMLDQINSKQSPDWPELAKSAAKLIVKQVNKQSRPTRV